MDAKNTYRLINEQMVQNYFLARVDRGVREHLLAFARFRRSSLSTSVWKTVGASVAGIGTIFGLMPGDAWAKGIAMGAVLIGGLVAAGIPWWTLQKEKQAEHELGEEERLSESEVRASRRAGIATEVRQSIVRVKLTTEMLALEPGDKWTKDTLEYWRQDVKEHLAMLKKTAEHAIWKEKPGYHAQLVEWCEKSE